MLIKVSENHFIIVSDSFLFLQYRAQYMPPAQQYPVTSGTASFYAGTSPAEYPTYGKGFSAQCHQQPSTTIIIDISLNCFIT